MIKKLLLLVQFLIISNINSIAIAIDLKNLDEQISYSLGFMAAEHAKSKSPLGIKINPNSFIQGFKDNFNNKQQLDQEQIIKSLNIIREKQLELQKKYMDKTTNPTTATEPTIPASTPSTQPSTATPVVPQTTKNPVTLGNPDINNFQDNNLLINTVQDINPKEISKNKFKDQNIEKNKSKDLAKNEALKEIIISEELAKPKEFIKKIVKELDKNKSNQEPEKEKGKEKKKEKEISIKTIESKIPDLNKHEKNIAKMTQQIATNTITNTATNPAETNPTTKITTNPATKPTINPATKPAINPVTKPAINPATK
ncbi:MAG: FKBP-type peptidyl-prolyl cis-trans isomerase N-terminal domain-containing protein, partial [Gammaproteobacteria bacterium]